MKAAYLKGDVKVSFKPFSISITLESLQDVEKLHAVMNYSPIADYLGNAFADTTRAVLESHTNFNHYEEFDKFRRLMEPWHVK